MGNILAAGQAGAAETDWIGEVGEAAADGIEDMMDEALADQTAYRVDKASADQTVYGIEEESAGGMDGVSNEISAAADATVSGATRLSPDPTDESLLRRAQAGETEAEGLLLERYRGFVRGICRNYFIVGAEPDDLMQEAMIGLYKAIRDYRLGSGAHFKVFARLCVTRQIITAIKSATRHKHKALNIALSLDQEEFEPGSPTRLELTADTTAANPEQAAIQREESALFRQQIRRYLSPLERQTLVYYLNGSTYREIAAQIGVREKTITNSMYRVQKKLRRLLAGALT